MSKTQLVFIHGPGAGGCADAWVNQLKHFSGSVAPTLPGAVVGASCPDVTRYMEWVRGWLWANKMNQDLVLVGYTLGSCIALQYALDYPGEVRGLVLTAVSAGPASRHPDAVQLREKAAAGDSEAVRRWIEFQRHTMMWVEPELRERLIARHRQLGPALQDSMLRAFYEFDAQHRINTLRPKLLLIRGAEDPLNPPQTEKEIHDQVPGSKLVILPQAGHFPATERPDDVNHLIEEFVASL